MAPECLWSHLGRGYFLVDRHSGEGAYKVLVTSIYLWWEIVKHFHL